MCPIQYCQIKVCHSDVPTTKPPQWSIASEGRGDRGSHLLLEAALIMSRKRAIKDNAQVTEDPTSTGHSSLKDDELWVGSRRALWDPGARLEFLSLQRGPSLIQTCRQGLAKLLSGADNDLSRKLPLLHSLHCLPSSGPKAGPISHPQAQRTN